MCGASVTNAALVPAWVPCVNSLRRLWDSSHSTTTSCRKTFLPQLRATRMRLVVLALLSAAICVGADTDHDWLVTSSPNDVAEVVDACWDWRCGCEEGPGHGA